VWGDAKRGIAIQKVVTSGVVRKYIPGWNVYHILRGKVILVHRDYSTKAEAVREAKSYARHELKHPKKSFFDL